MANTAAAIPMKITRHVTSPAQDLLLFHRLSWLLILQSILFSVWAAAFFRQEKGEITPAGTAALAFCRNALSVKLVVLSFIRRRRSIGLGVFHVTPFSKALFPHLGSVQ